MTIMFKRYTAGIIALLFVLALTLTAGASVSAQGSSSRDCDANAVIHCGALSTGELNRKYHSQRDVQIIFSYFGISKTEVSNMPSTAKRGHVTKSGKVVVGDKTV